LSQAERRIEVLMRSEQGRPVVAAFEENKELLAEENGN